MKKIVLLLVLSLVLVGSASSETIDKMMRKRIVNSTVSSDRYPPQIGHGVKDERGEKSGPLALFLSAAVPGAGEYYLGSKGNSKVFFGIELATWASYAVFTYHGRRVRDSYKLLAGANAGADMSMGSDEYWSAVEWSRSNEEYNEKVREDARALYPGDKQKQQSYIERHIYTGSEGWSWKGSGAIQEFRRLRKESKDAFQFAIYATGFALLNRLASAMDVIMITRSKEKKFPSGKRVQLIIEPGYDISGFRVGLVVRG